ncbi:MAG: hypothetical protein DHS20C18_24850 [Saprospiraceae bacterium]|nr:MAG: hypothetical protein DHS20C18_24850 [Saprospiraceae bacterium]
MVLLSRQNRTKWDTNLKEFDFDFSNVREKIQHYCIEYNVDYELLGALDLGRNEKGESLGGNYPEGVLELVYLLENILCRDVSEYYQFQILGKSLFYYSISKISIQEYLFIVNRIDYKLLQAKKELLKRLNDFFLGEAGIDLNQYIHSNRSDNKSRSLLTLPFNYSEFESDT